MALLENYAPGILLSELVEIVRKFFSKKFFFSRPNLPDFYQSVEKMRLAMEKIRANLRSIDRLLLRFCSIETRGETIASCSSVGDIGFCLANWCAQCMTACYRRQTITASTDSICVSDAISYILRTSSQKKPFDPVLHVVFPFLRVKSTFIRGRESKIAPLFFQVLETLFCIKS